MGREYTRLAFKPKDRAVNVRFVEQHTRIIRQVTCWKIIRAIDHDVVWPDQFQSVLAADSCLMNDNLYVGVDALERIPG